MAKRGRKNNYETKVVAFFPEIKQWVKDGATERQIAEKLGIGYSTFKNYKYENEDLKDLLKNGRRDLVKELRGALINRAMGFDYTEKKVVTEQCKLPPEILSFLKQGGFSDEEIGKATIVRTEVNTKRALPDVAALNLALKNYDSDNWSNDPKAYELKREELKLKKEQIERNNW